MDDETRYRVATTGEPTRLVRAYRHAVWGARRLRAWLIASGLDPDDLTVTAGVSESGQPVVHVTVLPVLAVHLSALIAQELITQDRNAAPPGQRSAGPRDDPNAA